MRITICSLVLAISVSAVVPAGAQTPVDRVAKAEALAAAGQRDEASRLLREAVAATPGDVGTVRQAARLYWSMGWGYTSVELLDALAARGPLDDATEFERASYLVRTGQAKRARDLYAGLIRRTPGSVEARVGMADALVTSGRRSAGRAEARRVLAEQPGHVEAMLIVGKSYAWTADAPFARSWFEDVLAKDPANDAAKLGLAEMDLGNDPSGAEALLDDLDKRRPGDSWLDKLRQGIRRPGPPVVTLAYDDYANETDEVAFHNWVARGSRFLGHGRNGEFVLFQNSSRYGLRSPEAKVEGAAGALELPVAKGQKIRALIAIAQLTDTVGESGTRAYGNAEWSFGGGRTWNGFVRANHEPYRLGMRILDEVITETGGTAGLGFKVPGGYELRVRGSLTRVAPGKGDSVSRWNVMVDAGRGWLLGGLVPVSLGYTYGRTEQSGLVPGLGYFGPKKSQGHSFEGSIAAAIPPRTTGVRLEFQLTGRYGFDSYQGVSDQGASGNLGLRLHVGGGLALFASGGKSDGSLHLGLPASRATKFTLGLYFDPSAK